jgi:hypothetical protein
MAARSLPGYLGKMDALVRSDGKAQKKKLSGSEFQGSTVLPNEQEAISMATLTDDTNPSGIEFDDAGPGAGVKAPGTAPLPQRPEVTAANKIAAVAGKAKAVPATKVAVAPKVAPKASAPVKKGGKQWGSATVERYKAQTQLQSLEDQGKTIFAIVVSPATQNSYDVFYY